MTTRFGADGCTCRPFTARTDPPRYLQPGEVVDQTTSWQKAADCPRHGEAAAMGDPELTAEEARDLVDQLGLDLYRAQDALAFVEECCTIADREGRTITTADVREWLKGDRCGRQLAASQPDGTGFVIDPAAPPLHFVTSGDGPSAREAAADDRRWFDGEREGE